MAAETAPEEHRSSSGSARRRLAPGGKTVYGARLGILSLETRFPRVPGDMGNAGTWPFPVLYAVVPGASPRKVVRERARGLLEPFLEAARTLVRAGADGITTSCGFLSLFQGGAGGGLCGAGGGVEPDAGALRRTPSPTGTAGGGAHRVGDAPSPRTSGGGGGSRRTRRWRVPNRDGNSRESCSATFPSSTWKPPKRTCSTPLVRSACATRRSAPSCSSART